MAIFGTARYNRRNDEGTTMLIASRAVSEVIHCEEVYRNQVPAANVWPHVGGYQTFRVSSQTNAHSPQSPRLLRQTIEIKGSARYVYQVGARILFELLAKCVLHLRLKAIYRIRPLDTSYLKIVSRQNRNQHVTNVPLLQRRQKQSRWAAMGYRQRTQSKADIETHRRLFEIGIKTLVLIIASLSEPIILNGYILPFSIFAICESNLNFYNFLQLNHRSMYFPLTTEHNQ